MNYTKQEPYRSQRWLKAVASLPCVICGVEQRTQAAHRNEGKGMGIKVDDCLTAALCVECHSQIDQGKYLSRDERRQAMDRAILDTLVRLARNGYLVL